MHFLSFTHSINGLSRSPFAFAEPGLGRKGEARQGRQGGPLSNPRDSLSASPRVAVTSETSQTSAPPRRTATLAILLHGRYWPALKRPSYQRQDESGYSGVHHVETTPGFIQYLSSRWMRPSAVFWSRRRRRRRRSKNSRGRRSTKALPTATPLLSWHY